jgi:hypothetical protein
MGALLAMLRNFFSVFSARSFRVSFSLAPAVRVDLNHMAMLQLLLVSFGHFVIVGRQGEGIRIL